VSHPQPRRLNSLFGLRASKERRPTGVSRKRKKQLGFESLEARQVMSANPIVQPPATGTTESYSSNTLEGYLAILQRELYWQSLTAGNSTAAAAQLFAIPTDPLVAQQWHLVNSGQQVGNPDYQAIYGVAGEDINVAPVWNMGYTGAGVTVAVIDSGIQLNHPDLAANISSTLRLDALSQNGNGSPRPDQFEAVWHGTAVAGIIGAVANNGIGGAGVAPGVTLVPIRLIDPTAPVSTTQDPFVAAFRYAIQDIDITNNSWGPGIPRALAGLSPQEMLALRDSIIFGRGGLGVIHVFSSGNSAGPQFNNGWQDIGSWDSSSYSGWQNSRYTITVTGVDHDGLYYNVDGTVTNYAEAGANVLVAAPTGSFAAINIADDTGIGSGIVTTDLTGTQQSGLGGANIAPDPITGQEFDRDFLTDTDYMSRMNGTSAAAPMVSGVIALMLEANPNLSWRDVQEILVRSARQNAQFERPQNGAGDSTANLWIVNQQPIFQEPDIFDPAISRFLQTFNPECDFEQNGPQRFANGAGYTVAQGYGPYGEQLGYGHGVIDAEMAVKLAEQWTVKGQTLAPELTFTTFYTPPGNVPYNIPAAERSNDDSGNQLVPGGIGGRSGFISYWEEYFTDDAFEDPDETWPSRGLSFLEFSVPDNNAMTVETVEVKISISGGTGAALDHMRMLLVSPEGTASELNHYFYAITDSAYQTAIDGSFIFPGGAGSVDNGGNLVWSFTTNRSWGERSENATVFDPVTGEPISERGWRLYIENYAPQAFGLEAVEMVWHGSPINAQTQRIQGAIGIDQNRDDLFNYNRSTIVNNDTDGTIRLFNDTFTGREVEGVQDLNQEAFAGNITVVARRASDGVIVKRFVTGADGNYYFDLVPDDYIISIEDPLGRTAQDDSISGSGVLQDYKSEWFVSASFFQIWTRAANGDVPVDSNGVPIPYGPAAGQAANIKGINFLLDPGDPVAPQVEFTGTVYADTNGDGIFNGVDVALANVSVYGDVNRNGQYDPGEILVQTDANGRYTLIVPTTAAGVINVGVVLPSQWNAVSPATQVHTRYAAPGNEFSGLDFYIRPSSNTIVGSGSIGGILLGSVFQDVGTNPNGVRDAGEIGAPGITVYIDANNNGVVDAGDTVTVTNQFGAYAFTSVSPGAKVVRVLATSPLVATKPTSGRYNVTMTGNGTLAGLEFGLKDTAVMDYGDLPNIYGATTLAQNGARHRRGVYFLGNVVDGELDGNPSANADGDDLTGFDDDDGIVFDPIVPGSTVRLVVTASRNNGYLKGWIDWNNDGDFDDPGERLVFSGIGAATNNVLLSAGANQLFIDVPAGVNVANVYARFRYGEQTINSIYGEAQIGEVEDYLLPIAPPAIPAIVGVPSDFTGDGRVDGADFLTWQRNFGKTTGATQAHGSSNGDGDVDGYDLADWKRDYGTVVAVASLTTEEDFSDAPQTLAAEMQSFSTPLQSSVEVSPATTFAGATTVAPRNVANPLQQFAARPTLATIAGNLTDVANRLRERADELSERFSDRRDFAADVLAGVAERLDAFDPVALRQDRAFADLFGSRRRQGLRAEVEAAVGAETEADEVFAAMADHFERPLFQ
jgi:subtilisin family serine protease